ncbi:MAG: tRNA pseudouridine(55) synthase TruB [Cytophagales bacterium]|nr:tRNA pseudouridine(55) synthase TruB [Bernardetiaceae bacterium]MDW8205745.1 tRNA pseudouridine(55) synthase TruB [Cytophagales bacterium]
MPPFDFQTGEVLLVDKPLQWTSFDVVNKIRYATRQKKVGHAGTLDPLATGLLIVCTGKKTKLIESYQAQVKEYIGTIVLGQTTPSYDAETQPTEAVSLSHISEEMLHQVSKHFVGVIEQLPPIYSAIKVNGERLYEKARRGEEVVLQPRKVEIFDFELTQIQMPLIHFRVVCSKGTYIRSLAHDFGQALGVGAYLANLRRTRIGDFSIADAWQLPELIEAIKIQLQKA